MARVALLLTAFAALAAWAGAQGPAPPLPADVRAKMFKSNRTLIDNLVGHGVDLANAGNPVHRARECRKTAGTLANSLARAAADEQDADRVVELAELMRDVLRDGLVPNLDAARETLTPGDPLEKEFAQVRDGTAADLDGLAARVPAGKVGDHPRVKAALGELAALKGTVAK